MLYCVKCKDHTENTDDIVISKTRNGRYRQASSCTKCGCKKSCFVKSDSVDKSIKGSLGARLIKPEFESISSTESSDSYYENVSGSESN